MLEPGSKFINFSRLGLGLILPGMLFFESVSFNPEEPTLRLNSRFGISFSFKSTGLFTFTKMPCDRIRKIDKDGNPAGFLTGGEAIRKSVLIPLTTRAFNTTYTSFTGCHRPWFNLE